MRDGDTLDKNPLVSQAALEDIHEQVFGWALTRCDYSRSAAEDLVQQAYVELLNGNARFDGRSTLRTFVFGVVQNLSRSRYRRLTARLRLARKVAAMPAETAPGPESQAQSGACHGVWAAVQRLPRRQRDVIELVFCRELTIEEASAVMGVTTGTGRQHYERAKKALRQMLPREQHND